jgi:hypothetical protein
MTNKKLFLFALTFTAVITLTALFSRAENVESSLRRDSIISDFGAAKETTAIQTQAELQVLAFEVTPSGFNPSETTIHQGKCLILLRNRTGRRDLTFWLARENGSRVSESEQQKRDWQTKVQLDPGTYVLGETNNPDWKSIIRVTN